MSSEKRLPTRCTSGGVTVPVPVRPIPSRRELGGGGRAYESSRFETMRVGNRRKFRADQLGDSVNRGSDISLFVTDAEKKIGEACKSLDQLNVSKETLETAVGTIEFILNKLSSFVSHDKQTLLASDKQDVLKCELSNLISKVLTTIVGMKQPAASVVPLKSLFKQLKNPYCEVNEAIFSKLIEAFYGFKKIEKNGLQECVCATRSMIEYIIPCHFKRLSDDSAKSMLSDTLAKEILKSLRVICDDILSMSDDKQKTPLGKELYSAYVSLQQFAKKADEKLFSKLCTLANPNVSARVGQEVQLNTKAQIVERSGELSGLASHWYGLAKMMKTAKETKDKQVFVSCEQELSSMRTEILAELSLTNVTLNPWVIGQLGYGLVVHSSNEIKDLVSMLAKKINDPSAVVLDARAIAMVCYGLQNLDGPDRSTKELVGALTKLITISCEKEKKPELDARGIAMSCYGLQNLDGPDESTRELVGALTKLITISCKQEKKLELSGQNIAMSCYGLQNLDGSDESTKKLVGALTKLITIPYKQEKKPELDARGIGMSCYGLQNLDGSDRSTKELAGALTELITISCEKEEKLKLDGQSIAMSCYGLQNLDGSDESTKKLVDVLTGLIKNLYEEGKIPELNGQNISMICYGLQNLDGSDESTKELAGVLTELITISCKQEKKPELDARGIGMSCYGLQNLDGSDRSTKELAGALTELITISCEKEEKLKLKLKLNGQSIAMSCYGLQNLDGSDESTKELVGVLTELITISCKQEKIPELNARGIDMICYGLQNLDGSDRSTKELVGALTKLITISCEKEEKPELDARGIGMSCYGLQNLDGSDRSTKELVGVLTKLGPVDVSRFTIFTLGAKCMCMQVPTCLQNSFLIYRSV